MGGGDSQYTFLHYSLSDDYIIYYIVTAVAPRRLRKFVHCDDVFTNHLYFHLLSRDQSSYFVLFSSDSSKIIQTTIMVAGQVGSIIILNYCIV